MKNEEIIIFLKSIVKYNNVEKEEKPQLLEIAKSLDIPFKETRCKNCWFDLAIKCFDKIMKEEKKKEKVVKGRWGVRENLDVVFRGIRINEMTINDELAEDLIKKGFPQYLLVDNGTNKD